MEISDQPICRDPCFASFEERFAPRNYKSAMLQHYRCLRRRFVRLLEGIQDLVPAFDGGDDAIGVCGSTTDTGFRFRSMTGDMRPNPLDRDKKVGHTYGTHWRAKVRKDS